MCRVTNGKCIVVGESIGYGKLYISRKATLAIRILHEKGDRGTVVISNLPEAAEEGRRTGVKGVVALILL